MNCKIKSLFISIALSFLIGCISNANFHISETVGTPFGTLAETIHFYDYPADLDEVYIYKHDITSKFNEGDALRRSPQSKRTNSYSSSKYGLTFIRKNYIQNSSPLIFESCRRFPSGLTEARQYLISLGKLTI